MNLLRKLVQRAKLVAVRITEIGKIEGSHRPFAHARSILNGHAAIGYPCRMPRIGLRWILNGEADRTTIGMGR